MEWKRIETTGELILTSTVPMLFQGEMETREAIHGWVAQVPSGKWSATGVKVYDPNTGEDAYFIGLFDTEGEAKSAVQKKASPDVYV